MESEETNAGHQDIHDATPRLAAGEEGLVSPSEIVHQGTGDNDANILGWHGASLSSLSDAPAVSWPPGEGGEEEGYYDDQLGGGDGSGQAKQVRGQETWPSGPLQQEATSIGQTPWDHNQQYTYEQYSDHYQPQPQPHWEEGGLGGPSPMEGPLNDDGLPGTSTPGENKEAEKTAPTASSGGLGLAAPHTSHRTRRLERLLRIMKRRPYFPRRLGPFPKPQAPPILVRHPIHESRRVARLRKMVTVLKRRRAVARKRQEQQAALQSSSSAVAGVEGRPEAQHPSARAPTHLSKPWPLVVQYINEVFSQCVSPGVQSTMHWSRLQAYQNLALLYKDLAQLDPYRRRMTGPLTITVNLSRKRSVTSSWQLQPPADDGTVEESLSGTLSLTTATSHDGKGSSTTSHSTASRERRQSEHTGATKQRKSSLKGLSTLQGLIPVKRKPSLNPKTSQQPPSSPSSSSNSNSTGRRVSTNAAPESRRESSAHDGAHPGTRKPSVLHALHAPLSVSGRRRSSNRSSSGSGSGSSDTSSRRQSSTSSTASFPREVIRDLPAGASLSASRDVIPFNEGQLAKEPLALLHKILRDPGFDRVPKRIRDFGDRDYAILSSMIKADVMVRTRAVSAKAKSLAFLTMAHEQSLMGATIRLGSYLSRGEVACLACCNKQAFQLAKTLMRNQRAAVLAQSGARLHLERQRFERLKHMWRSALNIQKVFRGYVLGRKKLQRNRVRLLRLQALGLEGDIIDVLEDKLLQPATRLETCRVIALLTKSRSVHECNALIELGFFKAISDQLKASDNTNEIVMMAITCLTNLLGGFTAPTPEPFRCHVIKALECLLCSTSFDEVETACRFIASLSPKVARGFPLEQGLLDCLVDLLMDPMEEGLFFKDFPFSLTARIKSWTLAAQAFLSAIAADPSLVSTDLAREGAEPAVVSSLLSVLHVAKVCNGRLLSHKYSAALVRHVRCACMEAIPVLAALHKELFRTYTFTDSSPDAQLALVADQLLHPSLSCSQPAHQHGLYILDIMCHDLKASMFLLVSGIVPTLESLLEIYLEGEMRDNLEKLVCLLTKPIVTPAEVAVPFNVDIPGDEQKELDAVVEEIQSFDANKENFADQACHVLLKALEEKQ